jgi:hypothetical protein
MTEDEAKTKWCPMARSGDSRGFNKNRNGEGGSLKSSHCIGSECMAWRVICPGQAVDQQGRPAGECGLTK